MFEPGTRNVISTTDGGVYVLDEDTLRASGTLNYNTGLNLQQVFGPVVDLACSLTAPDLCISGLQDNGVVTFNRNNDPVIVDPLNGVDGGSVSISPDGSSELFAMINGGRLYTTDSGASWDFFGNCFPNNYYATTMIDQTPARLAPNIYTFSGNFVYYKGVNPYCDWGAASSAPLPVEFSPRSMDVSNDPNGNVFYTVGWSTGTLYVMDSHSDGPLGSMTFEDRTPPLPSGSGFYDSQIAADRSSLRPYTVTYTTGISRPSRAYLSNDRGQHWTDVTGDLAFTLTDASYWKLVANPSDQTQLFLGTDVGIFRSDNGGANWYRYSDGMPAVASICGLELNFDQANPPLLHLGTYGRGFWDRQVAPDAAIQSVTLKRGTAVGGRRIQGEVQLNKAVAADITVLLSSTEPSFASVPATVTVPVGQQSAKFVVQTYPVKDSSPVGVLASHNGLERAAYFTVLPRGRK